MVTTQVRFLRLARPRHRVVAHRNLEVPNMSTITTKHRSGISMTRLLIAVFTCGLSLPFIGIRNVRGRSTTVVR